MYGLYKIYNGRWTLGIQYEIFLPPVSYDFKRCFCGAQKHEKFHFDAQKPNKLYALICIA